MSYESQAIDSLIQVLSTGNSAHRCYAAQVLGRLACHQAVPKLIELMRDEDIDVCIDAAVALGKIGSESAVAGLLESFRNDPSGEVRAAIADALKNIASEDSVDALLMAVQERDPNIEMNDGWDHWWDVQSRSVAALGKIGDPKAVPVIEAALDDLEGQDLSVDGLAALASLGVPGIEALMTRLENGSSIQRRRAVEALLENGGPEADSPAWSRLMALMHDQDPDIREALIEHLNAVGENSRLDPTAISHDADPQVRISATRIMGRSGDIRFVNRLTAITQDASPDVRREALSALAAINIKTVEPWFIAGLKDPVPSVAAQAAEGLMKIGAGMGAVQPLSEVLVDSNQNQAVRAAAARALGRIEGEEEAIKEIVLTLGQVIGDTSQMVRIAAITALAERASPDAQEVLLAALKGEESTNEETSDNTDAHIEITSSIVEDSQGENVAEEVQERLPLSTLDAIAIDNQMVKKKVAEAPTPDLATTLERNAEESEEMAPFVDIVQDHLEVGDRLMGRPRVVAPHQDIRLFAARVLGGCKNASAVVQGLIAVLGEEAWQLRVEALGSLGRLQASEAAKEVVSHLDSTQMQERLAAVQALGQMSGPGVADALLTQLEKGDPYLDNEVVRALIRSLGESRVKTVMIGLLNNPDPTLRIIAAEALANHGIMEAMPALEEMAYLDQGNQRREVGCLIGNLDRERGLNGFIKILNDETRLEERRVAIEVLGEILSQDTYLHADAA